MHAPEELKRWRIEAGLSQEQAAEKVSVRAATWCDWENGKKDPRTDRAQDLERLTEGRVSLAMWAEWARAKAARKMEDELPATERAPETEQAS